MQYIMQPLGGWGAGQAPGGLARLLERAAGWSLKAGWVAGQGCWLVSGGLAGLGWAGLLAGP